MFRSGETLGLIAGNKGEYSKHILKFPALYYFFPCQNFQLYTIFFHVKIPGLSVSSSLSQVSLGPVRYHGNITRLTSQGEMIVILQF